MNTVRNTIASIFNWFKAARPTVTVKSMNAQMGVHFEEVTEMIQEITGLNPDISLLLEKAKLATHELAEYLKNHSNEHLVRIDLDNRKRYLDALCDQIVTATGCAHDQAMNIVDGLDEVSRSNWSKFDSTGNPIFDENGKIIKGPHYFKADLAAYV